MENPQQLIRTNHRFLIYMNNQVYPNFQKKINNIEKDNEDTQRQLTLEETANLENNRKLN